MELNTVDLKIALEIVSPGLADKDFIEQATYFAFSKGRVFTFNDRLCVSKRVPGSKLECAIPSDLFSKYINKVSAKKLTIEQNDSEVMVKAGRSKAKFPVQNEVKLPYSNIKLGKAGWNELPSDFNDACLFVADSCKKSLDNAKLNAVHISNKGFVEGTDRMRISNWQLESQMEIEDSILVPSKSLITALKTNPTEFKMDSEWIHFKSEGTVISCRYLDEPFMDTTTVLQKPKEKGAKLKFTGELIPALERANLFAQKQLKEEELIIIHVMPNKLKIRSEAEAGALFEEFVTVEYKGNSFKFAITVDLLLSILRKANECTIYSGKLLFEGERWVHLTALSKA